MRDLQITKLLIFFNKKKEVFLAKGLKIYIRFDLIKLISYTLEVT